jgi:hypothetical protein
MAETIAWLAAMATALTSCFLLVEALAWVCK